MCTCVYHILYAVYTHACHFRHPISPPFLHSGHGWWSYCGGWWFHFISRNLHAPLRLSFDRHVRHVRHGADTGLPLNSKCRIWATVQSQRRRSWWCRDFAPVTGQLHRSYWNHLQTTYSIPNPNPPKNCHFASLHQKISISFCIMSFYHLKSFQQNTLYQT